jgi:3-keto-5-aminohexanoate cleavage enzyme
MVEPVIVELAVNGATPRHRNRHVPRTLAEITQAALAGLELGASIVHNHNDEPMFSADEVMAAGARGVPVARRWAHGSSASR